MKKLMALLLCLCMAVSLAAPAFASEAEAIVSAVTLLTAAADAAGQTETSQSQDSLLTEITEEKTDDSIPPTEDDPDKNNTGSDDENTGSDDANTGSDDETTGSEDGAEPDVDAPTSGSLTETISWALDESYILTITGTGAMPDYKAVGETPWFAYYDKITAVVIGEGVTRVGSSSFAHCGSIAAVALPEGLESIGDSAFNSLPKLTSITFPNSLKTIEKFAFSFNGLTSIVLPDSLETLGDSAFNPSNSITELTIPGGIKSLGGGAFGVCETLKTVTVEEGITHLGDCFVNCYAVETLNLPSTIQTLDQNFIILENAALKTINVAPDEANDYAFDCWADETGATFTSEELIAGADYSGTLTAYWKYVGEGFSDVSENDWYYEYVMYCYENGLMAGMTDGSFAPQGSATRAQVVMVLYRLADEPEVTAASSFSDVKTGDWFHDAVVWAADAGIALGYEDGTFAPNSNVTREEFLVFLHRFTVAQGLILNEWSKTYDLTELDISDAGSISSWAMEAQTWSVMVGLQAGYANSDGSYALNPLGDITRAELATFFARYYSDLNLYVWAEACEYLSAAGVSHYFRTEDGQESGWSTVFKSSGQADPDKKTTDAETDLEWWHYSDFGIAVLVDPDSSKKPILDWKYI